MKKTTKLFQVIAIVLAILCISGTSLVGGIYVANNHPDLLTKVLGSNGVFNKELGQPSDISSSVLAKKRLDFSYFWDAWDILNQKFYGDKKDDKRVQGAIAGMVAGLGDPYTTYFPPAESSIFKSDLKGEFGGIGAELTMRNQMVTVVAPMEGSPSMKAGVLAGDIILKVDDKKTSDYSFNEVVTMIRGDKGTIVTLNIARAGEEKAIDIKVTRDIIKVDSVKQETMPTLTQVKDVPGLTSEAQLGDIAYIKVNQFGDDTVANVQTQLTAANKDKKGIIIDLRNNPGGYLDAAVNMIGMVIPNVITSDKDPLKKRVAVIEKNNKGEANDISATNQTIAPTIPIVVLVNGGSASASEIFSGAMKDYGRAKIVGSQTFGKGSVQDLVDLGNGGSVKVTIAKWFTPLDNGIDGKGIEPDVKVDLADKEVISSSDTQVKKALEILLAEIK